MALIKIKESRSASDFLVCEVSSRSLADLLVYKVKTSGPAKGNDHLWYAAESSATADADVYFVNNKSVADLLICYVDSKSEAGWKTEHDLKGKIG